MAENPIETLFFGGRYHHGVDAKRRVQVPAKWRPEAGKGRYFAMAWEHDRAGHFLRVMPLEEMIRLRNEVSRKIEADPTKSDLKRSLGSEMDTVELDSAGRICLPAEMAKTAGIGPEQQVLLVGALTHFEIWNLERHENVSKSDAAFKPEIRKMVG